MKKKLFYSILIITTIFILRRTIITTYNIIKHGAPKTPTYIGKSINYCTQSIQEKYFLPPIFFLLILNKKINSISKIKYCNFTLSFFLYNKFPKTPP